MRQGNTWLKRYPSLLLGLFLMLLLIVGLLLTAASDPAAPPYLTVQPDGSVAAPIQGNTGDLPCQTIAANGERDICLPEGGAD